MSDESTGRGEEETVQMKRKEASEPPAGPERPEDLFETVEMEPGPNEEETREMQPILDKTTRRHETPRELIEQTRRSRSFSVVGFAEGTMIVEVNPDEDGRIELPPALLARLRSGERVSVHLQLPEGDD